MYFHFGWDLQLGPYIQAKLGEKPILALILTSPYLLFAIGVGESGLI